MTRLFFSLFFGLLFTLYGFITLAHLINTYLIIDVDNIIEANNISAEVTLLEALDPHISEAERKSFINMIAERNQLIIEPIAKVAVPPQILHQLQQFNVWVDDEEFDYFTAFDQHNYYRISTNNDHELIKISDKIEGYILAILVMSIALCCFIWFFVLHHKLSSIEKTLTEISEGNLAARASTKKSMKVGRLNVCVNIMADRIEQLLSSHKRLTCTIAHELRSPLFRMQMHLELLTLNQKIANNEHTEGLEQEIFCLQDMVDELLSYAQMERAELKPSLERIALDVLLQNLCNKFANECKATIYFSSTVTACCMDIDVTLITRAVSNLITNAEKYGNSKIIVSLIEQKDGVLINIEDDGQGIKEHEKHQIFEPFHRTNKTNNKTGFGLGLSIVKEIAQLHKGDIRISDSDYTGAKFSLYLPR
ncbi:ATP-binding protein [Pseudoalteromonas sp. MM17-2]|uniref:ATP-binding protein n=1 Tax=Pseudoalteromonas sp. MM17-2 TaxID=2917753 RepID=UPI001EF536E7|nr:ATP-binding protein [Pseudoalteromonas sp. MM17-2]MCG7546287.1 ATP-binding protein [Pseudoalteromonas sp. MM17-2]